MICSQCSVDKEPSNFLHLMGRDDTICNKCTYQNKMKKTILDEPDKKCLICKTIVKGRRWKFCSEKCAEEGNRLNIAGNWRHKINAPQVDWRKLKL